MRKITLFLILIILIGGITGGVWRYLEKAELSPQTGPISATSTTSAVSDNSLDADGFLWGTELWPDKADIAADVINKTLKTKYLKVRLSIVNVAKDKKTFSNIACFPSAQDCKAAQYDFDEVAQTFKANNWSMMPMLSYGYQGIKEPFTSSDIENYVNFVDWFVSRYKNDANIQYIELENCPNCAKALQISKELLLEVTNKIYDKLKGKYPDIMIGTPGFEYWADSGLDSPNRVMIEMVEYFLDKNNGAKFDFWAFHGYPLSEWKGRKPFHAPPTKTALYNKYAGVKGISEIRKKLDANGWQSRLIIDTEGGTIFPGVPYTEEEEKIDAAYFVQEALLKRTQKVNNKLALAGRMPMKINIRLNLPDVIGDITSGNLNSDGSASLVVKAVGLLWDKLNEYNYSSHISGEFDNENQVWVEKFESGDKELYIFFKPFAEKTCVFDNQTLNYNLNLDKKPVSIILTDISGKTTSLTPSQALTLKAENSPKFLEVSYTQKLEPEPSQTEPIEIGPPNLEMPEIQKPGSIPGNQKPSKAKGKCGDGICDDFEKAHPGLCPEDCQ